MKKFYEAHVILAILALFITACGTKRLPTQTEEQPPHKYVSFEGVLGKPMTDKAVKDFVANNNCSSVDQFQLCKMVGMAFWVDEDQTVKIVYLYAGGADGFN